eukprot:225122-Rhodomonas_salina.1
MPPLAKMPPLLAAETREAERAPLEGWRGSRNGAECAWNETQSLSSLSLSLAPPQRRPAISLLLLLACRSLRISERSLSPAINPSCRLRSPTHFWPSARRATGPSLGKVRGRI